MFSLLNLLAGLNMGQGWNKPIHLEKYHSAFHRLLTLILPVKVIESICQNDQIETSTCDKTENDQSVLKTTNFWPLFEKFRKLGKNKEQV